MAKHGNFKSSAPSRIRFVMVEAEIGDGDLGQITQAIQNALRAPATQTPKRLAPSGATSPLTPEAEQELDEREVEEFEETDHANFKAAASRQKGPRKPPAAPNVIDLDMNSGVSLADFAQGKDSQSQVKKYMIAAVWLKEHRNINAVTPDHIYTCFRSMGWPVGIADFGQPLRNLKSKNKYFSLNGDGAYEVNHLGLDFVRKLGGSNGTT